MEKPDLRALHQQISIEIASLDFDRIWPGFRPLKFALYNDTECFFDGRYIEKTVDFCANTAIPYKGETIAIWYAADKMPIAVFASKLVHEMFHGFQNVQGWNCPVDEMDALYRYAYDAGNLSRKLNENKLLTELLNGFDEWKYRALMQSRKYRSERFPYEFMYESCVEEIEGSANYVEWQVLKQLDPAQAELLERKMRQTVVCPESFFPIRRASYFTGALLIRAMRAAGEYPFASARRPVILPVLERLPSLEAPPVDPAICGKVDRALSAFLRESERIVRTAVEENDVVLTGPRELVTVNVYDARCFAGHLTSRFFVMYLEDGAQKLLQGNFVVQMRDAKTIEKVFRWNEREEKFK
jgi:hypothetical protein